MYGKLKNYSIIQVKWSGGGQKWYKTKSGRSIDRIVANFSNTNGYLWLKIFNYRKGQVGNKVFYHTFSGSYGYN